MFKNIRHNGEYFNTCKKYFFFVTLPGFDENVTKSQENLNK